MYAFYICLAAYLVFTYYERIKCIYIFSIYINMRAAVEPTHLSGQSTRADVSTHTRPTKRAVPARARNRPCRAVFGPG